MGEKRKREERLYEKEQIARQHVNAHRTSAKPPKKAPAIATKPNVCPNSSAAALPAPESAAAELAALSSAELLSPVADAPPPKPE
jgi:hypothetical protein